jgi:hypothetical protein
MFKMLKTSPSLIFWGSRGPAEATAAVAAIAAATVNFMLIVGCLGVGDEGGGLVCRLVAVM